MPERTTRVLVAGLSVRAFATSAARAGYRVSAVDAFGDIDLRTHADVVALRRDGNIPYSADAAARAARTIAADSVAYTANFENYPDAIRRLAAGRRLLGNSPEVVASVRRPVTLMRTLRRLGFTVPRTLAGAPEAEGGPTRARRWLVKPRRSGGGHGTRAWRRGSGVERDAYVQERIVGAPGSILFAADGRRAVPLGLSRQLVGDAAFGARGFRYCGSLVATGRARLFEHEERVREIAEALADAVAAEFGLVGVNGIDFVVRGGVPYPIEVNPRYSASMELIERARDLSIFDVHAQACAGRLPSRPPTDALGGVYGKAIVFAGRTIRLRSTRRWLNQWHADVPHSGERIAAGHPICTVFARHRSPMGCYAALARRAAAVTGLAAPRRSAA